MIDRRTALQGLMCIILVVGLVLPAAAVGATAVVHRPDDRSPNHLVMDTWSDTPTFALDTSPGRVTPMVAAGDYHIVGLGSDGTVVAVGHNDYGQCNVGGWTDIIQVAAGRYHTVGLKPDGSVVAVGWNGYGQCNVGGWTDIIQVAAGSYHTVGLKSDGTVVATSVSLNGLVSSWVNIVQVAIGGGHVVGLRSDGTVLAVGDDDDGQCNVGSWTDIIQVDAGRAYTVGLKSDGRLVAVGRNSEGQLSIGDWTGIVRVAAGDEHIVGLEAGGTAVAVGYNAYGQCRLAAWTGIIQVAASGTKTVGLKADGAVVVAGGTSFGQCNFSGWTDIAQLAAGGSQSVGVKSDGTVLGVGSCDDRVGRWRNIVQVAAGRWHTIGLRSDGTMVALGDNNHGQCSVGSWRDIAQVAASWYHTAGVKRDGTVVAVGDNEDGQCNTSAWTDIIQVAVGGEHTVGLRSDGTAIAVGANWGGQCDINGWTDIMEVVAGNHHTVGLRSDGTVVAVGWNNKGQCDVTSWTDIIHVAAGDYHTVGVKSDGTVVAVGYDYSGQCGVGRWTGIVRVAAGEEHTVGLKSDGTVVAVGTNYGRCNVGNWRDTRHVAASRLHTVGLKSDGTVVATGDNRWGMCDVGTWTDVTQVAAQYTYTVAVRSDGKVLATRSAPKGLSDWTEIVQVAAGYGHVVGLKSDGTVVATGTGGGDVTAWTDIVQVAAGYWYTVGLKSDGTVVAAGRNDYGQCEVSGWTDIVQVATSDFDTVGLRSDGTVVAVGENYYGQLNVEDWTNIIQVAAGFGHTVGLKRDGRVVAAGRNADGQCNVGSWTDIVQVAAGYYHTVGLRFDGSLVAAGLEVDLARWNLGEAEQSKFAIGDWVQTTANLNAREGPGLSHTIIDTMPEGSAGMILDGPIEADDYVWWEIDYVAGVRGWSVENWLQHGPSNEPPVALFSYYPTEPKAGDEVTFDASSSYDPDGEIIFYAWDWNGDGEYDRYTMSPVTTFWWWEDGVYDVRLAVFDNREAIGVTSSEISVSESGLSKTLRALASIEDTEPTAGGSEIGIASLRDRIRVGWDNGAAVNEIDRYIRDGKGQKLDWLKPYSIYDLAYLLGRQVDPVNASGLTYKTLARSKIEEEKLVNRAVWYYHSPSYVHISKAYVNVIRGAWKAGVDITLDGLMVLTPVVGAGLKLIWLAYKTYDIQKTVSSMHNWKYIHAMAVYLYNRGPDVRFTHEQAWTSQATPVGTTVSELVDLAISAKAVPISQEPARQKAMEEAEAYFKGIWDDYKDGADFGNGLTKAFRQANRDKLKQLLLSELERRLGARDLVDRTTMTAHSPIEPRIIDSEGRRTGVTDGIEEAGIPHSVYDDDTKTITVFLPGDCLTYEVSGTDEGGYGLNILLVGDGRAINLVAIDVTTSPSAIHQYAVDWDALAQGEPGITIEKDHDGDGEIDETIITGIPQTPTNPLPMNNATDVSMNTTLSWTGDDSESVTYNVYFGTSIDPLLVSERQAETTCLPELQPYTRYYWRVAAINEYSISGTGPVWSFVTEGAGIAGEIREVNCDVLDGVKIALYRHGDLMVPSASVVGASYTVGVLDLDEYELVASKDGYRDVTRWIEITELGREYELCFRADHGLIPNAPNMSYVLACINLWQFGEPQCKLTMSTVLAVINAWQFPVADD